MLKVKQFHIPVIANFSSRLFEAARNELRYYKLHILLEYNDMSVATATISSKYQIVIPKAIRQALGLRAGDVVTWIADKSIAVIKPRPKNWTDYAAGLGKKAWKGVNPEKYISELRDEWETKEI